MEEAPFHSSRSLEKVNGPLTTYTSASRLLHGEDRFSMDTKSLVLLEQGRKGGSSKRPHVHPARQRSPPPLLVTSAPKALQSSETCPLWWWPTRSVVACAKPARHRHRPPNGWLSCNQFLPKLALLLNCHILALDSTPAPSSSASDSTEPPRPRPPAPPRPTFSLFRSISTVTLCLTTLTHFSRVFLFCLIVLHSTTTAVFSIDDNEIEKSNVK